MVEPVFALIDQFSDQAKKNAHRIAVKEQQNSIVYERLAQCIDHTASWLLSQGLYKGDRVGIHLKNSIEYVIIYYACWRARLVPVALNTLARKNELEFWLTNSGCKIWFSKRYQQQFYFTRLFVIDFVENQLLINGVPLHEHEPDTDFSSPALDDIATIIYSSGTTGDPKGITLTQRNLAANISAVVQSLGIRAQDNFLCVLPFFYSFGNSILHSHLTSGATLRLLNQVMYPAEILKTIQQEQCNGFAGVPSLYLSLLKKTHFDQYDLSSLRYMTQAGGPLAKESIYQIHTLLPHVDFVIMYGQTEATARISYLPPDMLENKLGSVGKAIHGVVITVLNRSGEECKPGEIGEICVEGENIMAGYWGNPLASTKVLRDNRLHTGDMGYKDKDGYLFIEGRQTEILKISEHRVSPYEIEEVLLAHQAVEECAVIGCSHHQMGQFARAFIVKNDQDVAEMQLKKHCKQSLASYKVPKQIVFVESLPKTTSGKIKRGQLSC